MRSSAPPNYAVSPSPTIPGGMDRYLDNQLRAISNAIQGLALLAPQSSTEAPKTLVDGMVRLSRNPWRPVAGQVTDQWVYYDLAGLCWRLLSTAPTTS